MRSSTGTAVVLPVKSFAAAKQRLRGAIADDDRAALARHLASGVLSSIHTHGGARAIVACDDEHVRRWAEAAGAEVAWTPTLGLNGAIDVGVEHAIATGAEWVVVAHADLARPERLLDTVGAGHQRAITVVPDRHRDGTNVLAFSASLRIHANYGPGSFDRHLARARRAAETAHGVVRVVADIDLGLDVDTVADLVHPAITKELPAWLRTRLANPSTPPG